MIRKHSLLLFSLTCLTTIIIYSCKKDSSREQKDAVSDPTIVQAKAWYESAYPVGDKQATQSTSTSGDLSQLLKPDWQRSASYKRGGQPVLEIPIDPSVKFEPALKNMTTNSFVYSKDNSRSSFLLLKDAQQYNAYIMTIIADPAYLNNDKSKLDHDKYNKRDTDFSGVVLYSTPKGAFISGWFYKNGRITQTLQPNTGAVKSGGQTIQSLKPNLTEVDCTDWYQYSEVDGTVVDVKYLGSTCTQHGGDNSGNGGAPTGGSNGGSGGGTGTIPSNPTPPPPPPCTGTNSNTLKVQSTDGSLVVYKNIVQPPPGDGDGTYPPPTTPSPPPTTPSSDPCTVTIPAPDIIDSLTSKYPCTKALIAALPNLNTNIARLLFQAFDSKDGQNMVFVEGDAAYFSANSNEDGITNYEASTNTNTISINPAVLANSSNEYRLATLYHEAIHAFLNTEFATLGSQAFAIKYPMINVVARPNFSQVVIGDKYDYYLDPTNTTKVVGKDHVTMAEYFMDGIRDAILAYNPNFPPDRAMALAEAGIVVVNNQVSNVSVSALNDAERDVTKGHSVGIRCTP